jgi:hypothetical protein
MLVIMGASGAFAADPPTGSQAAPSKEMREKMATLHEQMVACLRSDKPIADCHSQMMQGCQDTMGKHGCTMTGHGMMGSGPRRHHHTMQDAAKNPEDHK